MRKIAVKRKSFGSVDSAKRPRTRLGPVHYAEHINESPIRITRFNVPQLQSDSKQILLSVRLP
jgi:hypothetical protein